MASCSQAFLHNACSRSGLLRVHLQRSILNRSFVLSSSSLQQPAVSSQEEIVIPRKKTWNKVAVLQALAGTVKRDVTAYDYRFQDDPLLSPSGSLDVKILTLAEESGRNVAKYFISTYPKYFQTDYAEPHIPCFMPEVTEPQIEGVSEAALKERIQLRRVTDAVDLYDQLLQGGNTVSLNVTNDLLDLICLYGDRDPVKESFLQQTDDTQPIAKTRPEKKDFRQECTWNENNNAERIFGLLSEPNTRSYSALIQGMVKHGAFSKAIETYTDLRRNGLIGDVAIFNALIRAVWGSYPTFSERVEKSMNFLVEMESQKIKPNLNTFNAILKCLLNSGKFGRTLAFSVFSEMKALNIEPSLGSYNFLIYMFYNAALKDHEEANIAILDNVMNEISGKSFTPQHPEDGFFFTSAMTICLKFNFLELAYKVHELLNVGENWRFLSSDFSQTLFYAKFFELIAQNENIETVLKWYRDLIPSVLSPNMRTTLVLLKALDAESRLDLIPQIWEGIKKMNFAKDQNVLNEILALMAREKHSVEVQESFAECALDIMKIFDDPNKNITLQWTVSSIICLVRIFLAAQRRAEAWNAMGMFQRNNRVPTVELLTEFLECSMKAGDVDQAVELLKLSAGFCIPDTPKLIQKLQEKFELSETHRSILADLEVEFNFVQ